LDETEEKRCRKSFRFYAKSLIGEGNPFLVENTRKTKNMNMLIIIGENEGE
jgi:hypothetical protein